MKEHTKMDPHTLDLLEFGKIRKELTDYSLSSRGARRVHSQPFIFSREKLEEVHQKVEELLQLLEREDAPAFEFPPIEDDLKLLETEGTVMEGSVLYGASRYFLSADRLKNYLQKGGEYGYEQLPALSENIPVLTHISKEIEKVLDPDGTVKESHPELRELRKRLGRTRNELNRLAGGYVQSRPHLWQSQVPAQRDGRLVLALKSNYRGQVDGVVHYVSSKGATVFIEPPEMLEKNNEVAYVQYQIEEVVRKILREMTDLLRLSTSDIADLLEAVSGIDTYYCRARYAGVHRCRPAKNADSGFYLKSARHPLLGESAVPIDIETEEDISGIIITGPNAGGKTVTLKTVGIFALMNQFGMHLPAEEGSRMAVFDGVYADIGDDQSIEGSVSTFSGHMNTLSRILAAASRQSLVLLDETGSGTDPREGAALGMAVIDELIKRRSTVLVTSHHGLLKNYGYTTEGVENASMDFDDETLSPTYRVVVGVPGDSHALDIASRSGLGAEVLDSAKRYLSGKGAEVSRMIRELERKHREMRQQERQLKEREGKLKEEQEKIDQERLRIKEKEHELHTEGYSELSGFLKESRRALENLVQQLKEGEVTREETKEVKNFIHTIEVKKREEESKIEKQEEELFEKSKNGEKELQEGMEVFTAPGRTRGRLLRRAKKGHWLVEAGVMKITLPEKDIIPAPSAGSSSGRRHSSPDNRDYSVSYEHHSSGAAVFTLDVRGKRLEDALDAATRQIDEALLANLREFYILHGKGEGILQQGIHKLLAEYEEVETFDFTRPEEGGTGKTYVKLKL
ncbi:MAG: endonuclease MutS2 [Spirochaetaceae bacterium]